jgi:hypothetical protein
MTSVDAPEDLPARPAILRPYGHDLDSPGRRRARRWVVGALAVFSLFWGLVFAFLAPALIIILAAPVGILMLITIWALPDLKAAPTRALERLFFIFVVVLIVWPNYLSIILPNSGLPWISIRRLTSAPLSLILLICVAVSRDFRSRLAAALKGQRLIFVPLLIFVVIQTYSIGLSSVPFGSLNKWVDAQMTSTALFFVACYVFTLPGRVERWAAVLWVCAIVVGLIGVWEWRLGRLPWAGHLPAFLSTDPDVAAELTPHIRAYTDIYRVQSTFGTSLGLGQYLALTMPFLLHFALGPYSTKIRIAAGATVPFLCLVTLITHSRSGMIGVLMALGLYAGYWGITRWRRRKDSLVGPAVVAAYPIMAVLGVAATFVVGRLHSMVWGGGEAAASTGGRTTQYHMGIPMVVKNPIGYGIARGAETLGFREPGGLLTIDTEYLKVALEYGVLGFFVYYFMILYSIYAAARHALADDGSDREISFLSPACIALTSFFVINAVFSQDDNNPLYFGVIGMVVALIYRAKPAGLRAAAPSEAPRLKASAGRARSSPKSARPQRA